MKKQILILSLALVGFFNAFTQNAELVVFSEFGEKFKLYLNNRVQNETPQSNVKVTDLSQEFYKARIEFEEKGKGILNKNLAVKPGMEVVYMIKQGRKGYVVRYRSESPLESVEEDNSTYVTSYETGEISKGSGVSNGQKVSSEVEVEVPSEGITETEETTMKVEFGGMNIEVNSSMTTKSSTSTTTSSTSATSSTIPSNEAEHYVMPGYNGNIGCPWPMDDSEFASVKKSISSKTFEDSKLSTAKQVAKAKCFTADQVKQTMEVFTYEDSRLEFAQFAYDKTFDIDNYYMVNDAFEFELTIDELQEYIDSK
jgi:hypothetical protein